MNHNGVYLKILRSVENITSSYDTFRYLAEASYVARRLEHVDFLGIAVRWTECPSFLRNTVT